MRSADSVTTYTVNLDLGSIWAPPQRCPGCGATGLVAVGDGEETRFRCPACGTTWLVELGWVAPVGADDKRDEPDLSAADEQG